MKIDESYWYNEELVGGDLRKRKKMREQLAFDLNEIPVEEDAESHKEIFDTPFIGQCFLSEEEAFLFYQKYAKMNEFSVRYGRFENKKKTGEKKRRDFFCHREGTPE
ncbi:protein FAR1-related sequence 11, partial [Tanacetum coccineum]